MWVDIINGSFELLGAPFILMSVFKLAKEKQVHGVSWMHVGFFSVWGFWNLFYYPYLDQWFSLLGGIAIVIANMIWLIQVAYYSKTKK